MTETKNDITFLFSGARSSYLESDQIQAETLESEHFQTIFRKSNEKPSPFLSPHNFTLCFSYRISVYGIQ